MISAHASMSREEQLVGAADGNGSAAPLQRSTGSSPARAGWSKASSACRFPQIVPIRQGNAALLLPLARFRVEAEGAAPWCGRFVVGQPGQGSSLQPFRLDQGPRSTRGWRSTPSPDARTATRENSADAPVYPAA
jgi:hypothetical protein